MKIVISAPPPPLPEVVTGDEVTARRWSSLFQELGHRVEIVADYGREDADVLVALHARTSAPSVRKYRKRAPDAPLIVALTSADLYQNSSVSEEMKETLALATHVVALQPGALDRLDLATRSKTNIIYQSARRLPALEKASDCFQACLVSHLRDVEDSLIAGRSVRQIPPSTNIQVVHVGEAFEENLREQAEALSAADGRYRWLGPVPHEEALLLIARSHVLLLTSRSEGGANVLSEALAMGVPILACRAPGIEGVLGNAYPGFFPPGEPSKLAELLERAERDQVFFRRLERACWELAPLVSPSLEKRSWAQLLSSCQ